ncbi:MAG: type IV pilus assembly protein PilX [Candidatus Azotimanducaceae bacterium]|jgi:type IV pilus assembly protein PilX
MSLVMLLIITVLGLSSVQTTTLQERMARNARDTNLAFQATEAAIKDAETMVETFTSLVDFGNDPRINPAQCYDSPNDDAGLYYERGYNCSSNWVGIDWSGSTGFIAAATAITGVAEQPKYIVEHVKTVIADEDKLNLDNIGQDTGSGRAQIFRITVFGTGGTDTAHVMIQSTYGRRF